MKSKWKKTFDARAQVKLDLRERIDLLGCRMGLLKGEDRLLMQMYLENGNSFRQMARLIGVNEATIGRRIHKLTKRLLDGEYITCLRNRDKLCAEEMRIARAYLLEGLSQRKIAKRCSLSRYAVRNALRKVQEMVRIDGPGERKGP